MGGPETPDTSAENGGEPEVPEEFSVGAAVELMPPPTPREKCTCARDSLRKAEAERSGEGCVMDGHDRYPSHRSLVTICLNKFGPETVNKSTPKNTMCNWLKIPDRFRTRSSDRTGPIPVALIGCGDDRIRFEFASISNLAAKTGISVGRVCARLDYGGLVSIPVKVLGVAAKKVPGIPNGDYYIDSVGVDFTQKCEHVFLKGLKKDSRCDASVIVPTKCRKHTPKECGTKSRAPRAVASMIESARRWAEGSGQEFDILMDALDEIRAESRPYSTPTPITK